jgi:hypothetical protein
MEFAAIDVDGNKDLKYVHQLVKLAHREEVMCSTCVPVFTKTDTVLIHLILHSVHESDMVVRLLTS